MLMDVPDNHWPRSGRSLSSLCLISIAILAAHGCDSRFVDSDELVEVRGQVYLDGAPVAGARILFMPSHPELDRNARFSYGTTDANGGFSLRLAEDDRTGAFPGLNRVVISKAEFEQLEPAIKIVEGGAGGNDVLAQTVGDTTGQPAALEVTEQIPSYYNSQSELTCELIPGQGVQQVRFDLVSIDPLLKK